MVSTRILSTLTSHYTATTKPQRSSLAVMFDPVQQAQHRTLEFPTGLTKDTEKTRNQLPYLVLGSDKLLLPQKSHLLLCAE